MFLFFILYNRAKTARNQQLTSDDARMMNLREACIFISNPRHPSTTATPAEWTKSNPDRSTVQHHATGCPGWSPNLLPTTAPLACEPFSRTRVGITPCFPVDPAIEKRSLNFSRNLRQPRPSNRQITSRNPVNHAPSRSRPKAAVNVCWTPRHGLR